MTASSDLQLLIAWGISYAEFLSFFVLSNSLTGNLPRWERWKCFLLLLMPSALTAVVEQHVFTSPGLSFVPGCILMYAALRLAFRKPFLQTFILFVTDYMLLLAMEILQVPFWMLTNVSANTISCLGTLTTFCAVCLLARFLPLHQLYRQVMSGAYNNSCPILIIANSFLVASAIAIYMRSQPTLTPEKAVLLLFILLLLILINGEVAITRIKNKEQQQELAAYEKYLPIVENLIEKVRIRQHDYDNALQTLQGLGVICHDYNTLRDALDVHTRHYMEDLPPDQKLLNLNLHLLAGFLTRKYCQINESGKNCSLSIEDYALHTACSEYDLITCLGILIDNAMEATQEGETICLTFSEKGNRLRFEISNPGPELSPAFCKLLFMKGGTTKSAPGHGIGLYKLKQMVQSYGGTIRVFNYKTDDQTFLAFELII